MIRISRLSDYSILVLCEMSSRHTELMSARALSDVTTIGEWTIMKILKLLLKADILRSVRGAQGGYCLARSVEEITILDVVTAIDGDVSITMCTDSALVANDISAKAPEKLATETSLSYRDKEFHHACEYEAQCVGKNGWNRVNNALKQTLADFTVADFLTSSSCDTVHAEEKANKTALKI